MRIASKVDTNQTDIVQALRKVGCTVQILSMVGYGCPDILCGRAGQNYLLEIKDGAKSASRRKLTPDEMTWHETWRGQVAIVDSIEAALRAVDAA